MTAAHPSGATETDSESATPARAAQLERARRIDWRFLLPDPRLHDVAFLGRDDGRLVDALRAHSQTLVVLDALDVDRGSSMGSDGSRAGHAVFGGIVIRGGTLKGAARARTLLRPGGWLYWEMDRRRAPFATPVTVARRLQAAGYESIALHWHRPGFGDAVDFVPLGSPRLLQALLRRGSSRLARRALAHAAGALHPRLLVRTLPCWSVVARASGGAAAPANAAAALLPAAGLRTGSGATSSLGDPGSLAYSFRLPRFTASSHVVAFVHGPGATSPTLVMKVPRLAGDDAAVGREAAALAAVQGIRPEGFDSIPRLVACTEWAGSRWLVQTALEGSTMTADWVRHHEPGCVAAVLAWLLELHRASRGAPLGPRGVARLLGEPLAASTDGDIAALAARTLALAPELASLPTVFEHGDLAAPNLLIAPRNGASRIGVVDWESADPHGLAGADLVFFLAFVAGARARARTPAEHAAAYRGTVLASSSGRARLEAYVHTLGLPRAALPAILVATWARATLRMRARAGGATAAAARPLALWRETLEHLGTLEP